MLAEFGDALLVDIGQEAAGQEHAVLRMPDARQRFRPGEAFALEIDLRLVPDFEPLIPQRLADGYARPPVRGFLRPLLLFGFLLGLLVLAAAARRSTPQTWSALISSAKFLRGPDVSSMFFEFWIAHALGPRLASQSYTATSLNQW